MTDQENKNHAVRGLFCPYCGSIAARIMEKLPERHAWHCNPCGRTWDIECTDLVGAEPSQAVEDRTEGSRFSFRDEGEVKDGPSIPADQYSPRRRA